MLEGEKPFQQEHFVIGVESDRAYTLRISLAKVSIVSSLSLQTTPSANNKLYKRGCNVNAQEWKPSRRTSAGNALKDIPMLDMFLQRLDRHAYTNGQRDKTPPEI